jgi:hypothetical protein
MDFTAFIKRAQILMENRTANPLAPPISGKHQSPWSNTDHLSTGFSDLTTLEIGDFSSPKRATPALDLQTARPKTGLLF